MWTVHNDMDIETIKDFATVMRQMGNWHERKIVDTLVIRGVQRVLRKSDPSIPKITHFTKYEDDNLKMYILWKYSNGIDMWSIYAWGVSPKILSLDASRAAIIFAKEFVRFLREQDADKCYFLTPTFTSQEGLNIQNEFSKLLSVEKTQIGNSFRWFMKLNTFKVVI